MWLIIKPSAYWTKDPDMDTEKHLAQAESLMQLLMHGLH